MCLNLCRDRRGGGVGWILHGTFLPLLWAWDRVVRSVWALSLLSVTGVRFGPGAMWVDVVVRSRLALKFFSGFSFVLLLHITNTPQDKRAAWKPAKAFKITTTLDSHRKLPLLNSYKTSISFNLAFAKTCVPRELRITTLVSAKHGQRLRNVHMWQ